MHNEQSEVYIQAKLMFIQTIGKQNVYFAGALAPNFEQSEKITSDSLYYRKFCLNAHKRSEVYIQAKLMVIQTEMPLFITEFAYANLICELVNKLTSHGLY